MSQTVLILTNLIGFTRGADRFDSNDVWHFVHHCLMPNASMPKVMTVDQYFKIGQEMGRRAAKGFPGTYIKERDNGEILVYWEPAPGKKGLFMAVAPIGTRGEIKTLFPPDEGKRYFDDQKITGFRVLH
jgi:hypothetical protein